MKVKETYQNLVKPLLTLFKLKTPTPSLFLTIFGFHWNWTKSSNDDCYTNLFNPDPDPIKMLGTSDHDTHTTDWF